MTNNISKCILACILLEILFSQDKAEKNTVVGRQERLVALLWFSRWKNRCQLLLLYRQRIVKKEEVKWMGERLWGLRPRGRSARHGWGVMLNVAGSRGAGRALPELGSRGIWGSAQRGAFSDGECGICYMPFSHPLLHSSHVLGNACKCCGLLYGKAGMRQHGVQRRQKFQTRWMSLSVRCHSVRLKAICHPWISLSAPSLSFSLTLLGHLFTVDLPDK